MARTAEQVRADHEAAKQPETWRTLPFVGVQAGFEDLKPLELRNCVCCGDKPSTLAVEVGA